MKAAITFQALCGLVVCGLFAGCAAHVLPPAPKRAALVAPPSPDGMALARPARTLAAAPAPVIATNQIRITWYQPGAARGWVVEESTNLRTWRTVMTITNSLGSNARPTNSVTTVNNPAYWRVGSFN